MDAVKTGCLIAEKRKELNLTQSGLAQRLHVSPQAVSKWERGLSFPDVSLLEPLAQQLDLTVSELLSGKRNAAPQEELIRDSLRLSISQLGAKAQTWRKFFLLVAVLLLVLSAWLGHSYVKNHAKLLPQRETIISYRESTPSEQLAANVAGGKMLVKGSMFFIPLLMIVVGYVVYLKKYKIDEQRYAEILKDLEEREKA